MNKLTDDINLNAKAVEKLIEISVEHSNSIQRLQFLLDMIAAKLESGKAFQNTVSELTIRMQAHEDKLSVFIQEQSKLTNRIGSVELDAGIDNKLYDHNIGVVNDWHEEAGAGFNSDMIPLSEKDIKERYGKYTSFRSRR